MKRVILLMSILVFLLLGCTPSGERLKEPVTFYYVRSDYQFFREDGVIVSEEREASGHKNDLSYLLTLYLMGPTTEDFRTPLPKNTRVQSINQTSDAITIQITVPTNSLSDSDFSLGCACISLTCFDLLAVDEVTVVCGERSTTMNPETITYFDNSNAAKEAP